jgi:hypothetical protein
MLRANDVKRIPLPCEAEVVYEWRSSPQAMSYLSILSLSDSFRLGSGGGARK